MKYWTRFLVAAAAAAGCSGITANANVSPNTNLAQYHTYDWASTPGEQQGLGEQEVRAALQRELAQKGMTPATTAPPDFLVAYHERKQQQLDVTPGYGYWDYPSVQTYTEGTLIVDFIDPRTNKVFWRGTASGALVHPDNPDPKKIDTAVAKLVHKYPGPLAASASRPAM